jgi:hypothetical protein
MASKSKEPTDPQRIREVIDLLHRALEDCHRLLGQAETDVRQSQQDNSPPIRR